MPFEGTRAAAGERVFTIDDELKDYLESGVATVIGTADDAGRPGVCIAWGTRVHDDRRHVSVFIEVPRAETTMANVRANGRIALTSGNVVSHRSVQLKGRCAPPVAATPEDEAWVQRHRDAFSSATALVGDPPQAIRNLMMIGPLLRLEFEVDSAFDQTPGPQAGSPL